MPPVFQQKEEVCENDSSTGVLDVCQKLVDTSNSSAVSARYEKGSGILAISVRPIKKGEPLLQCHAASISLDPHHRTSRCSFCAVSVTTTWNNSVEKNASQKEQDHHHREARICKRCQMVVTCKSCAPAMQWHAEGCECQALQSLSQCFQEKLGIEEVDSIYVLTVRLIIRRWYDRQKKQEEEQTSKEANTQFTPEKEEDRSKESLNVEKYSLRYDLPPIDWYLFDLLYHQKSTTMGLSDLVTIICEGIQKLLSKPISTTSTTMTENNNTEKQSNDHTLAASTSSPLLEKLFTKERFEYVLGRVLGCCHAITDLRLPLGCQSIGRALFLHHSFYNHSCCPNSILACHIGEATPLTSSSSQTSPPMSTVTTSHVENKQSNTAIQNSSTTKGTPSDSNEETLRVHLDQHVCGLLAQVHSMTNVEEKIPITLSYIPMSGIDCQERRQRLHDGYCFQCNCKACCGATQTKEISSSSSSNEAYLKLENAVQTPVGSDLQSLREVQFNCNERLLRIKEEDDKRQVALSQSLPSLAMEGFDRDDCLDNCLMMIRMSQRGIQNQGIPPSHEVSIEAHRLLAMALSLQSPKTNNSKGDDDDYTASILMAIQEHCHFFEKVHPIQNLFDPLALATQHFECSQEYKRCKNHDKHQHHLELALDIAGISIGKHHFYYKMMEQHCRAKEELPPNEPPRKKLKTCDIVSSRKRL